MELPDKLRWSFRLPRCLAVILLLSIKLISVVFFIITFTLRIVTAFLGSSRRLMGDEIITPHSGSSDWMNLCRFSKSSAIVLASENEASLVPTCATSRLGFFRKRGMRYWCMSAMVAPGKDRTFLLGPILDSSIPPSMLSPTMSVVPRGHNVEVFLVGGVVGLSWMLIVGVTKTSDFAGVVLMFASMGLGWSIIEARSL